MYEKNKLSEQAQKVEDALKAIPPKYDVADEILSHYSVTAEELSKLADKYMKTDYGKYLKDLIK